MSEGPPAGWLGTRGLAVAWHGPLGPAVARFESWSREAPSFVRALGHAGADRPATPALWARRDHLLVAWCEEDGAWIAPVGWDDGAVGEARLVLPGARTVAMVGDGERGALFGADAEGLVHVAVDGDGRPRSEPARAVAERRAGVVLSATWLRDEALLIHVHRGAEGWGVVSVRGDAVTAVDHRTGGACEAVDARAAGSRTGVVLERAGGGVRFALLGPEGKVIERPHAVFGPTAPPLVSPQVVWTDDDWTLLAREPCDDRLWVHPASHRREPFELPRCDGPFAAAYWVQHLFALELDPTPEGGEMRLWRCTRDGASPQQRITALRIEGAPTRRRRLEVRSTLGSLADRLGAAAGYRDRARRPRLSRDGGSLSLHDERGRLRVTVEPGAKDDGAPGLALRVSSALGDDPRLPETPSSLVRLARWIRARLSPAVREREAADRAWADELAGALGATAGRVERAGATLLLELWLEALPEVERLARWLRRLRDEQAGLD
ncbi:MAG TPA: hypothetical protein RMH99_00275 [Sandaracinaceae bacterium LLY-WYZ-13_1]|nr:hypothetical protein [Sandaracinaceae bacterium LLY-WYZ-13_1]